MQLLVLALMLMTLGKNANLKEIEPILQSFGGAEAADAIKQAEELSDVISAVQSLMPAAGGAGGGATTAGAPLNFDGGSVGAEEWAKGGQCDGGFPLAPIANIADERITYCLSRYIALGE